MQLIVKNNQPYLKVHGTEILGEECGVDCYFECDFLFLPMGKGISFKNFIEVFEDDFPDNTCIHMDYNNSKYGFCISSIVGKKDKSMFYSLMASYEYETWGDPVNLMNFLPVFCDDLKRDKEYRVESLLYPDDNSFDVSLIFTDKPSNRLVSSILDKMAKKLADCHKNTVLKLTENNSNSLTKIDSSALELVEGIKITAYNGKFFSINIPLLLRRLAKFIRKS